MKQKPLLQRVMLSGILFIMLFSTAHAQYNTRDEWYIGATGGASLSTITLVPKLVDKMYLFGKTGGLTLRYVTEDHFGIQAELNYLETGWKEDLEGLGMNASYIRNLRFAEVPILVHAYNTSGLFHFTLNAGSMFSYLLSENETIIDASETFTDHGKWVEHPLQYGLQGGVGIEAHLGKIVFGLDGRYRFNLSDIFNNAVGDDFSTSSLQTITLNAYLLVKIH
jgi:hypothetical protein